MGLGSRTARRHLTAKAVEAASAGNETYWDFKPGQRVMTCDGFPGVVAAVHDGPFAGNEEYTVTLDGGLGGGAYTASQLREESKTTASHEKTAADDYPELGNVLTDRPDIAINTVLGSKTAHTHDYEPRAEEGSQTHHDGDADEQHMRGSHPVVGEGPYESWFDHQASKTAEVGKGAGGDITPQGYQAGGATDYADGGICPRCGGHRMLHSSDGTVKCENCGYLDAGDSKTSSLHEAHIVDDLKGKAHAFWKQYLEQSPPQPHTPDDLANASVDFSRMYGDHKKKTPTTAAKFAVSGYDLLVEASTDPSFRMSITAAWSDVRSKAKRLRSEGHVNITAVEGGQVIAQVQGDHDTYETILQHHLGSHQAVSAWNCGCAWAKYAWGRSGEYRRYEGRMCSHALATQFEVMSRKMFGGNLTADDEGARLASFVAQESPVAFLVQSSLAAGDEAAEIVLALRTAGIASPQRFVHLAGSGDPSGMSTGEGLDSTGPAMSTQGPTTLQQPNDNPASTGWASGPDPADWGQASNFGRMGSLDESMFEPEMTVTAMNPTDPSAYDPNPEMRAGVQSDPDFGLEAVVHDVPEAALPVTDGTGVDPDAQTDPDGDVSGMAAHGSQGLDDVDSEDGTDDLAPNTTTASVDDIVANFQASAGRTLMESGSKGGDGDGMSIALAAKMALKDFSPAEQQALINEGATEGVTASNLDRLDIAGTHYEALEAALASANDDDDLEF